METDRYERLKALKTVLIEEELWNTLLKLSDIGVLDWENLDFY